MKAIILAVTVFAGSMASALTCQDGWGNKARISINARGMTISSARYGSSGFLSANGQSDSSYYYRNGQGALAIVNKSILAGGQGRVVYSVERMSRGDSEISAVFYCN